MRCHCSTTAHQDGHNRRPGMKLLLPYMARYAHGITLERRPPILTRNQSNYFSTDGKP